MFDSAFANRFLEVEARRMSRSKLDSRHSCASSSSLFWSSKGTIKRPILILNLRDSRVESLGIESC